MLVRGFDQFNQDETPWIRWVTKPRYPAYRHGKRDGRTGLHDVQPGCRGENQWQREQVGERGSDGSIKGGGAGSLRPVPSGRRC